MRHAPETVHTVLCVHGDPADRESLADALVSYSVTFVGNAFDAIVATHAQPYHAYILDQWLPDLPGIQLCREIRRVDPHAPILFCTAAARDEDLKRALRAGANSWMEKPFDAGRFRRQIKVQIEIAELESRRASMRAARAMAEELERQARYLASHPGLASALPQHSVERIARTKAYKVFLDARGTRAHFESWWPDAYGSARARITSERGSEA